jgi:hypothetical protein
MNSKNQRLELDTLDRLLDEIAEIQRLEEGYIEDNFIVVIDKISEAAIKGPVKLIQVKECKQSNNSAVRQTYPEYIQGLLEHSSQVVEGNNLRFYRTNTDGAPSYGWCKFSGTMSSITRENNYVYFHIDGKDYRLEYLDGPD